MLTVQRCSGAAVQPGGMFLATSIWYRADGLGQNPIRPQRAKGPLGAIPRVGTHQGLRSAAIYLRRTTAKFEYAVVGLPHDAPIYAHEILHLFGADDLYMAAYDRTEEPMRQPLIANCIMFDVTKSDFSTTLVDDLTAQNVGWL